MKIFVTCTVINSVVKCFVIYRNVFRVRRIFFLIKKEFSYDTRRTILDISSFLNGIAIKLTPEFEARGYLKNSNYK